MKLEPTNRDKIMPDLILDDDEKTLAKDDSYSSKGIFNFIIVCILAIVVIGWYCYICDMYKSEWSPEHSKVIGHSPSLARFSSLENALLDNIVSANNYSLLWWLIYSSPLIIIILYQKKSLTNMEIHVTNKRIFGKTNFGNPVNVPLDSISAVSMISMSGVCLLGTFGEINFKCLSDNEAIYNVISDLLLKMKQGDLDFNIKKEGSKKVNHTNSSIPQSVYQNKHKLEIISNNESIKTETRKSVVSEPTSEINSQPQPVINNNVVQILKRAMFALEDGDFDSANSFAEMILNNDAENAEAYLVKLMIEYGVKNREDLKDLPQSFENSGNYKKAIRFGNQELKDELNGYLKNIELTRKRNIYIQACELMKKDSIMANDKAIELFESIKDYEDSMSNIEMCKLNRKNIIFKRTKGS